MGRAQSTVITEVLMASAALIIGAMILTYFTSFSSTYSRQLETANLMNYEAINQVVRLITYDSKSKVAWLLLRRLDGTQRNFLLMVSVGEAFLGCGNVFVYVEPQDTNGLVCDESDGDCVPSCAFHSRQVPSREVFVWTESGAMPLYDFLERRAPQYVGLIKVPYPGSALGYRIRNMIVKVELGGLPEGVLRVYLGVEHEGRVYVVRVYEVNLA